MKVCEMNWKFSLKNLEKRNERSHSWWWENFCTHETFPFGKPKVYKHYVLKLINENKYSWDFHFSPAALSLAYGEFPNTVPAQQYYPLVWIGFFLYIYVSYFIFRNWNINIFWILFQLFLTEMIEKKKSFLLCSLLREKFVKGGKGEGDKRYLRTF